MNQARQKNKSSLWLGVWEDNLVALAFYQAQGFYQVGSHPFNMGGYSNGPVIKERFIKLILIH
ncbi:GNAT family N-acetyltransferase [Psychromonas sp. KJ10-10]|uniref:GNAT family N-acetyltransferase n=1 Tax=Psychromonas sp. KJ10-10 TaxID=3391823 RepID=UPI0039B4603C